MASAAAWEIWKNERFGPDSQVSKTPWFELVDQDLRQINNLVQSPIDDEYHQGLQQFWRRVEASQKAEDKLAAHRRNKNASKEEIRQWLAQTRRTPPVLDKVRISCAPRNSAWPTFQCVI